MNKIIVNNKEISSVYLSNKEVQEIYLGLELVYPSNEAESHVILNLNISDPAAMLSGDINGLAIQLIRKNSHRVLARKTGERQVTYCRLDDNNSNYYYDGTWADISGIEGDVFVKLPLFFWKITEKSTNVFDIGLIYGKKPDNDWNEWDGNILIGAFKATTLNNVLQSAKNSKYPLDANYDECKQYAENCGEGYQLVDWEMHCVLAMLGYCQYGVTNVSKFVGSGRNVNEPVGNTASFGMRDTTPNDSSQYYGYVNFWGLDDWYGSLNELLDNVTVTVDNTKRISRWDITELDGTIRLVSGIGHVSNGIALNMVLGSKFDLVWTKATTNYEGFYCKIELDPGTTISTKRACRSSSSGGGLSYITTVSSSRVGSRLAFRGECIEETDVKKFKEYNGKYYGVLIESLDHTNQVGVRVGNMEMHKTLPILSKIKGCTITSNGVVKYLNPTDWTKYEDGTDIDQTLNVMVEIPEYYYLFGSYGSIFIDGKSYDRLYISEYKLPFYSHVNKLYVSAYDAYKENNILKSLKNKVASYDNLDNFLEKARANGSNHWNAYTYETHKAIAMLFIVEYATYDILQDWNPNLTSEGYHLGGLGIGATSGTRDIYISGISDIFGNSSGSIAIDASANQYISRYRGIENIFGNVFKIVIDVLLDHSSSKIYFNKDYNTFGTDSDLYNLTSMVFPSSGGRVNSLQSSSLLNEYSRELLPYQVLANGKFDDTVIKTNYTATKGAIGIGGYYSSSKTAGLFSFCRLTPTATISYIGTRLTYLI